MDFNDSPEEAAFRAEVRNWLTHNAPSPEGGITGSAAALALSESKMIEVAKAWQARKFDAGYAAITWPKDLGGRDVVCREGGHRSDVSDRCLQDQDTCR